MQLAVIFEEIPSREVEKCIVKWTRDVIKNVEYETVFAISELFCIRVNLGVNSTEYKEISKNEDMAIKKIARMTA